MSEAATGKLDLPEPPGAPPSWDATIQRAHRMLAARVAGAFAIGVASFVVLALAGGVAHAVVDADGTEGGGDGGRVDAVEVAIADANPVAEPDGVEVEAVDAVFVVSLSAPAEKEVRVTYETQDDTATGDEDYETADATLVFAPGEQERPLAIRVVADRDADEDNETFRVALTDASNAEIAEGADAATGTIVAYEPVAISIAGPRAVAEPDEGDTVNATFAVALSRRSRSAVTVQYATEDGSAVAGEDYTRTTGTLTFAEGEREQTLTVPILADEDAEEGRETLRVVLSNPSPNAIVAEDKGEAEGTIEPAPVADVPTISIADAEPVTEPGPGDDVEPGVPPVDAVFIVSLSGAVDEAVTVDFTTEDETATADADYRAAADTLTIPAGQSQAEIRVRILGDRERDEGEETFRVVLSKAARNAEIEEGKEAATGTIVEEEERGLEVSIEDASPVTEPLRRGEETSASFFVVLSRPSEDVVTVTFATADGTAQSRRDYGPVRDALEFKPGETRLPISVPVLWDQDSTESAETFQVVLVSASPATIADNAGTGTIREPTPP